MTDIQSQVPVQRAQWVLAEQPGREVTQVRDDDGDLWIREVRTDDPANDVWLLNGDKDTAGYWSDLLVDYGPLDDATPGGGSQ